MATVTLVPLGTYPAQTRSFEAAIPAGTTSIWLTFHAPVQSPFDFSIDILLSKDGGATWAWASSAGCTCRATESGVLLDTHGCDRLRADVRLTTPITISVTAATTP